MANAREEPIKTGVSVAGSESMQRCANGNVLVDRDRLAVRSKDGRVVVVVGDPHFDVRRVHVSWIRVLDVDRHVVERMQQRVKVDWLPCNTHATSPSTQTTSYIAIRHEMAKKRQRQRHSTYIAPQTVYFSCSGAVSRRQSHSTA